MIGKKLVTTSASGRSGNAGRTLDKKSKKEEERGV